MPLPDRVAFTVFGAPIYWYGLLIMSGLVAGGLLAAAREKRLGLKKDTAIDFMLLCVPLALICARAYYVAFEWRQYAENLWLVFDVRGGGMAIYGAILGGALAALIFSRRRRAPFGLLADLAAPSLAIGQAIGRWGNFVNQEAYGRAVEAAHMRFFPLAVYIEATGQWHYATFFYESAWCFLLCAGLLIAERKKAFYRPGDLFWWYALLYAVERALVEGLRTDSLWWGPIRVSQALSLLVLAAGLVWFFLRARHNLRWIYLAIGIVSASAFVLSMPGGAPIGAWLPAAAVCCLLASAAALYGTGRRAATQPMEDGQNQ
ncbi:MAG: prolipoprotein diacylglyceryl transferase [Clostridiales bacterium]|nr:prolipoprotein diacylglyceryl transferase [Clostridiales bacterium]